MTGQVNRTRYATYDPGSSRDRGADASVGHRTPDAATRIRSALLVLAVSLLLTACGEDPIGPDNRMALLALGNCQHAQAMQLTDNALERGNPENRYRALVIQAVILSDQGLDAESKALYPEIATAWEAVKLRSLSDQRRERDLALFLKVAQDERRARGLDPDCARPQKNHPTAE